MNTLHFEVRIEAYPEDVWYVIFTTETYREWTSVFHPGSYFAGEWKTGATMRFLTPEGDGMIAEIAQARPFALMSIKLLGCIRNGVEDTTSEQARAWTPAFENYTLVGVGDDTRLTVQVDVAPEHEAWMNDIWPRALASLKALCEAYADRRQPWRTGAPGTERPRDF